LANERYNLVVRPAARRELEALRSYDERRIFDSVRANLLSEPTKETRKKKKLEGIAPGFEYESPLWQLSVGEFRVFYDVNEKSRTVFVRAVRNKSGGLTTQEIVQ
jgi:mRNA-degrading endonuclease RelE of RelBE toxin-antitoxin system